jgi:glycosyltransferase involved in cell wall biosynthesis
MRRLRKSARIFETETVNDRVIATHFALYALPLIGQLWKSRHVVHFHGPWADEALEQGGRPHVVLAKRSIERLVYSTGKRFITLSDAFKGVLMKRFGVAGDRIEVIPGGVDAGSFSVAMTQAAARDQLHWPRDRRIVLCVRRLISRMGLEQLIEALCDVRRREPEVLFLIAGEGELHQNLESKISELGLGHWARLLGFVPDSDLAMAYRAADLSIVPSQSLEGFGLVTLESLAAGTPVLVTPVDGLPEAVAGLSKSLVLDGTTSSDIAQGLVLAMAGGIPLPSESECADYVRKNFDWSVIAPRVLRVYRPSNHLF